MAHFAQLDENNIVIGVIVVDNDKLISKPFWDPLKIFTSREESEEVGIAFCKSVYGKDTRWKKTSYSSKGYGFRGTYAGIGMSYMSDVNTLGVASTDIFIDPNPPHEGWTIGIHTADYVPPGPPGYPEGEEWKAKLNLTEDDWRESYVDWDYESYKKDPETAWKIKTFLPPNRLN